MSYVEDNKKLLESLPENTKFVHTPGQTWYSLDKEPHDYMLGKMLWVLYKDGSYEINNDQTTKHPFTWEYLPVYTYDSNGTADTPILYSIVENPDPGVDDYEKAHWILNSSDDEIKNINIMDILHRVTY